MGALEHHSSRRRKFLDMAASSACSSASRDSSRAGSFDVNVRSDASSRIPGATVVSDVSSLLPSARRFGPLIKNWLSVGVQVRASTSDAASDTETVIASARRIVPSRR